jgi:uncharacterized protein (UPF0248 family)
MRRPASDPVFTLPAQTLLKLKPARDMFYLRRSIPDLAQFRLAYWVIKTWAKRRGLFSAKFGYLGGIQLSTMLVLVCKMLSHGGHAVSVPDIITTFFAYFAKLDWRTKVVFDPFFHKKLRYTRTFREPLCLLGWHAPILNTAHAASMPTVRALAAELREANHLLSQPGATWQGFLVGHLSGAASFVKQYKSYIKVDIHYWGSSQERGNQYVGWLESRCVLLLVEIDRKVPHLVARVWPTKFVQAVDGNQSCEEPANNEYRGCLLVGLDLADEAKEPRPKEDIRTAEGALLGVLSQFEQRIRGDEKYYEPNSCWMGASVVRGGDLGQMEVDHKDWGTYSWDGDSDPEDEDEEAGEAAGQLDGAYKGKGLPCSKSRVAVKKMGVGKFRPASDVMNRLKWDEKMDCADYIVGYEDRFVGAREKALDSWKTEQTDEEFIPQHRILYFKRRSDGVFVWERSTRTDLIFGSGQSASRQLEQ